MTTATWIVRADPPGRVLVYTFGQARAGHEGYDNSAGLHLSMSRVAAFELLARLSESNNTPQASRNPGIRVVGRLLTTPTPDSELLRVSRTHRINLLSRCDFVLWFKPEYDYEQDIVWQLVGDVAIVHLGFGGAVRFGECLGGSFFHGSEDEPLDALCVAAVESSCATLDLPYEQLTQFHRGSNPPDVSRVPIWVWQGHFE